MAKLFFSTLLGAHIVAISSKDALTVIGFFIGTEGGS